MNAPAVTVLLPVFNGGELLGESIASVLAQTWRDFELLVVDDGSTDGTAGLLQKLRDPRLRVLTNAGNLGLTRSLNRGLAEARGELIARQDADDLSAPTRLEKQVAYLRAHPEVQLLGTSAWRLNAVGRITGSNDLPTTRDALRWASIVDNPFLHTSVVFRRAFVLEEFDGYDERFAVCQDFHLWSRIAARFEVANLRERLVGMREHAASMTRVEPGQTSTEMAQILGANCALVFPDRTFSDEERQLLASFRLRFSEAELPALRAFLEELLREFLEAHPAAGESADFRATLCRQALRLGYKFLESAPITAASEILRAARLSPREWLRQASAISRRAISARAW